MANMITDDKKILMKQVVNCFEMGTPNIKYDVIYIYNDGPGGRKQLTLSFGIIEYGDMKKLIQNYIATNGEYSTNFKKYIDKIGVTPLVDDKDFKSLLIEATQKDQAFRNCIDELYDDSYWGPAYRWFVNNGFTQNLSMMVLLDSFVHSGSILGFLRNRFKENVPASGGDEKNWISEYVGVRRDWLATHSNPILRNTVYRMDFMKTEMAENNWDFSCPLSKANGVTVC